MKLISCIYFLLVSGVQIYAQFQSTADILLELGRLRSPYRVLYLAAHPDDENTRLISYLTADEKVRTAYLSLTRGDGGQNLIGDEKGAMLGVLRTEELLSARRIDRAEQFFTHAVDFGYSKTSKETFNRWGKENILADVVYIIRYFRPHVIINRFPPENYAGHGHHQASAILGAEAFNAAANPELFKAESNGLSPWKTGSLYVNTSSWWDKTLPERAKNDNGITVLNVGKYNPMTGYSYTELAALSRSQHKSQGFGSAMSRGEQLEYLELIDGISANNAIFHEGLLDKVDSCWLNLQPEIDSIVARFSYTEPADAIPDLVLLREKVHLLSDSLKRFDEKLQRLDDIIASCLGLKIELIAEAAQYCRGESLRCVVRIINRSNHNVLLDEVKIGTQVFSWNRILESNVQFEDSIVIMVSDSATYSNPYWLNQSFDNVFHHDRTMLEHPGNQNFTLKAGIKVSIADYPITYTRKLVYQWTDRVRGGVEKSVEILPIAALSFDNKLYFPKDGTINGKIIVKSNTNVSGQGELRIVADSSIHVLIDSSIVLPSKGEVTSVPFSLRLNAVYPINHQLKAELIMKAETLNLQEQTISYDHIRPQSILQPATSDIVVLDKLQFERKIAYVAGPDNEMISLLKLSGCDITTFTENDLAAQRLKEYNVLLFGVRSLNVDPVWNNYADEIKSFMKKGGIVVVMYQTNRDINPLLFSPYSFEISRNRITEEDAVPTILLEDHPLMTIPYKIQPSDFDGWNQERGLYFADKWSVDFKPLISWHDTDEAEDAGAIIVGDYGKGAFIYTGISFFRHIPEGIPGSYKLMMNILSYKSKLFESGE